MRRSFGLIVLALAIAGGLYLVASPPPADILSESFEGAGYEATSSPAWAEVVGTGCAVDEDATEVSPPLGGGSQVLKIVHVNGQNAYTYKALASDAASLYSVFRVRISSYDLSAGPAALYWTISSAWDYPEELFLANAGGELKFRFQYTSGETTSSVTWPASGSVQLDRWYSIQTHYDASEQLWAFLVDGEVAGSGSLSDPHSAGGWLLGFGDNSAGGTSAFYVDRYRVSTAGYVVPDIDIAGIADGGSYDFGSKALGTNTDYTLTVSNSGGDTLNLTAPISIVGADVDQFSVQTQPDATVAAGGTTTFKIRFSPTSAGVKTAAVSIGTDDADENPYDIALTGTAVRSASGKKFIIICGAIPENR